MRFAVIQEACEDCEDGRKPISAKLIRDREDEKYWREWWDRHGTKVIGFYNCHISDINHQRVLHAIRGLNVLPEEHELKADRVLEDMFVFGYKAYTALCETTGMAQ